MDGQDQVLETIATVLSLTGPLIRTGGSQLTAMEDIRLFIRDMLLEDMVVCRMDADDVFDDAVATYERRDGIVEEAILGVGDTLELEVVTRAERNIAFCIIGIVHGQVQRHHYT